MTLRIGSVGGRRGNWRLDVAVAGGWVELLPIYVDMQGIEQEAADGEVALVPQDVKDLIELLRESLLKAGITSW
jgi:hypothetical protein